MIEEEIKEHLQFFGFDAEEFDVLEENDSRTHIESSTEDFSIEFQFDKEGKENWGRIRVEDGFFIYATGILSDFGGAVS